MKKHLQCCVAPLAALVCTALWFAPWLLAFDPAPRPAYVPKEMPSVGLWVHATFPNAPLHAPTLFALPAEQGFSGEFPEKSVGLIPTSWERPRQSDIYLERNPTPRFRPEQPNLNDTITLPHDPLEPASVTEPLAFPHPGRIALFLSPELQARTDGTPQLEISGNLPESIRVYLKVRPDGSIDQTLFDPPIGNGHLTGAVRQLRFLPALQSTEGWLDIRVTPLREAP